MKTGERVVWHQETVARWEHGASHLMSPWHVSTTGAADGGNQPQDSCSPVLPGGQHHDLVDKDLHSCELGMENFSNEERSQKVLLNEQ